MTVIGRVFLNPSFRFPSVMDLLVVANKTMVDATPTKLSAVKTKAVAAKKTVIATAS
jgi:hypothetical protein